jgi:hypothetical protein
MKYELYEVWSVDSNGHEQLIDTTRSLKEARTMAEQALTDDVTECRIYRDVDGELELVEELPL